jgi:hypothetical protein
MHTIPMFPVGHWIEVLTGPYRGWRGVVSGLSPGALHQPAVRLLLDDRADHVPMPVDLDLRIHDVKIRGLAPGEVPFEVGLAVAG